MSAAIRQPIQDRLAGRYIVGEPFASGGMGTVHLGRVVGAGGFSRVVAIKRLFPGYASDRSFRQMFLDEARLASRVRHPNVVPTIDLVEAEQDLYVVMEYVRGLSLAQLLERSKDQPVPLDVAAGILEGVLLGLHAAHEARQENGLPLGIVHRDVSPRNILVGADGVARIIDFGIAKAATHVQMTDPGMMKGTAGYISPEQFLHRPVSRQADVYAAAVVLWETLANRRLFSGLEMPERVRLATEGPIAPPSHYRAGVGSALDQVVARGLEAEPSRRFPTADAMATALRNAQATASPVATARWLERSVPDDLEISDERLRLLECTPAGATGAAAAETGAATPTTPTLDPRAFHGARSHRRGWFVLAASLVILPVAAVVVRAGASRARSPQPSAAAAASARAATVPADSSPTVPPPSSPIPPLAPVTAATTSSARMAPSAGTRPVLPSATSRPAVTRGRRRPVKPSCELPYTIDAKGTKRYDPDCF